VVLVWVGRPVGDDPDAFAGRLSEYLRAKKYQLQLHRGYAFVFDESTKELVDVIYDGQLHVADPKMDDLVAASGLFDPAQSSRRLPRRLR
jgi:hypothetical protein